VKTDWKVKNVMKQNLIVRKQWLSPWDLEFRKTSITQVPGVKRNFQETKVGRRVTSIMSTVYIQHGSSRFSWVYFFPHNFRFRFYRNFLKIIVYVENDFIKYSEIVFEPARGRRDELGKYISAVGSRVRLYSTAQDLNGRRLYYNPLVITLLSYRNQRIRHHNGSLWVVIKICFQGYSLQRAAGIQNKLPRMRFVTGMSRFLGIFQYNLIS
jgi:hypothetical protein